MANERAGQIPGTEYAARRAALAAEVKNGVALLLGALEPNRDYERFAQDPEYIFRRYGAERPGFATIIGSGATPPRSTIPE